MKKLLMLVAVVFAAITANAQKFDDVKKYIFLPGQTEQAKAEVDKLFANTTFQSKAELWLWRAKVYSMLYKDEKLRAKYTDAEKIATESFQKYASMEPGFELLEKNNLRDIPFDIYQTAFGLGVKSYNAKDWNAASNYFKSAVSFSDLFYQKKWASSSATMDTTSILYTGIAYQNANNMDEAYKYFQRLADSAAGGKDFDGIYRFVLSYQTGKKDYATFKKYKAIAQKVYPQENWEEYELDYISKNYSLADKTAMYDKEDAAGTFTEVQYLQFGDWFVHLSEEEKKGLDSTKIDSYGLKAAESFKKAYAKNNANAVAAFNVGVIINNERELYDDRIRSNQRAMRDLNVKKEEEKNPQKKLALTAKLKPTIDSLNKVNAALDKPMSDYIDVSIEWLEKAYNVLKDKEKRTGTEKNLLNKAVDILADLYQTKRDRARGKDPKVYDAMDAKFKQFDALHDKF
jgi:hypothetical protein